MRRLIACALLALGALFCLSASAAPSCWPKDIGGTGAAAQWSVFNKRGPYAGWWCPDGTAAIYAVRWGDMNPDLAAALEQLRTGSDKPAAATALLTFVKFSAVEVFDVWQDIAAWKPVTTEGKTILTSGPAVIRYGAGSAWVIKPIYGTTICGNDYFSDPAVGVLKSCEVAILAGGPPAPAPAPTWKVKPNPLAADKSRPVYSMTADASSMIVTKMRVAAGVACDPSKSPTKASGSDMYATPDGFSAGSVALCEKVAP